jgi:hypothetical protein
MKLGGIYAVHLRKDDGEVVAFLPGDDVPSWAAKQITNPLAWGTEPEQAEVGSGGRVGDASPERDADGPPPQGGTGATRQRWADYATAHGVDVQDDWKREDIIAACEKAGVPV